MSVWDGGLDEAIDEAIRAPDFQTKQTWIYEVQRLHTDKYAIVVPVYVGTGGIAAKYPEVHDDGIYEITGGQWTPADAWLGK